MKKLRKLSLILLIPFIAGIIFTVAGIVAKNDTVLGIGIIFFEIVFPVMMFIMIVISLILMMTGRLSDKPKATEGNNQPARERQQEYSDLGEINSTYGRQNRRKKDEYMIEHTANNYRNASAKEKVLGWLFFGFLMTDFALIPIFAFTGITIGAIICFCLFGGTIILSLIITKIKEHASMHVDPYKIKDKEILCGIVKACMLSSATSVGGSRRNSTSRITGVVYRVIIFAEGNEYTAFSKEFYNEGDEVNFAVIGKHSVAILQD